MIAYNIDIAKINNKESLREYIVSHGGNYDELDDIEELLQIVNNLS